MKYVVYLKPNRNNDIKVCSSFLYNLKLRNYLILREANTKQEAIYLKNDMIKNQRL